MAKKSAEELVEKDFPATGNETPLTEGSNQSAVDAITEAANAPIETEDPRVKTLNRFTGTTRPQPTVDGIMAAGTYGPQAESTYFPGANNNINKGQYSGSIVGSVAQYAPSGLYPYGLIDARKQALARAADAKVAEQEKWADKMSAITAPQTKRTGVQPDITKNFYSGMQEFVDKARKENPNADPNKAVLRNPEFHKYLDDWRDVTKHEDEGVESVANFAKEAESNGKTIFGPQKEIMNAFQTNQILQKLTSTDPKVREAAKQEMEQVRGLKAMRDPQTVMTEGVKAMQPDVREGMASINPEGLYDVLTTTKKTGVNETHLRDYMKHVYDTEYGGNEKQTGFTYNDFAKGFASQFGNKTETQTQTASTKGSDGADQKFDESAIQKEQSSLLTTRQVTNVAGEKTNYNASIPAKYGYTMKSPVKVKLAGSEEMYDLGDSQGGIMKTAPSGVKDVAVQNFTHVPTVRQPGSDKYVPVDEEGLALAKKNGLPTKWALYGVVSFQGDEANEFKQKTALVPAEQLKNSVQKTKGKEKTGVDFDKMAKYTEELNSVKHTIKGKEYSQAAVEKAAQASGMSVDEYVKEANR